MHVFELALQFSFEILGFVLIGTFTVLSVHAQFKMREIWIQDLSLVYKPV
jgi:hypothetical protein